MKILNCVQRSEKWFAAKLGIPSASSFDKIITTAGKSSKQAEGYAYNLAGERITGKQEETYTNATMQQGVEREDEARQLFEMINEVEIRQVGFVLDDSKRFGCSPDGLMDDSGLEIKSPLMKTHVGYLLKNDSPVKAYWHQIQGSMLVCGYQSWWIMSYYPAMPPLIIRVERDATFCAALKKALDVFCEDLDELTEKLRSM